MWKFLKTKWTYKLTDNDVALIQAGNAISVTGVVLLVLVTFAKFGDFSGNHIDITDLLPASIIITVIGLILFIWSCVVIYKKGEKHESTVGKETQ